MKEINCHLFQDAHGITFQWSSKKKEIFSGTSLEKRIKIVRNSARTILTLDANHLHIVLNGEIKDVICMTKLSTEQIFLRIEPVATRII